MATTKPTATAEPQFYALSPENELDFYPHEGQHRALNSTARFVLLLSGTQGGKSVVGPLWLFDEIQRRGAGDYLCIAPSYPLMQKKMLPEFLNLFETYLRLGDYKTSERTFVYKDGLTKIFFGHADDPESLEAATAKAAWLDEAGQNRFKLGSWEAILRRLSIHRGRVLITTTPYNLGWLYQQVYRRWEKKESDYDVINFDSRMNPAFPQEEYDRAKRDLPRWKFDMFYRGRFTRPAGLIYDCFDTKLHVCPTAVIPAQWPRFLGLDFGGVNTAGVFLAANPASPKDRLQFVAYREYHAGGRTAKQHTDALTANDSAISYCVGGSKSEGQWRDEFAASGLAIREPPISEVEVGINRLYALLANGQLQIQEHLTRTLDMIGSYSREVDANGEPTEKIEDKASYHELDALRYLAAWINQTGSAPPPQPKVYRT